ncbi:MAG: hypothetical protein MUE60_03495, partial [Candidatus Eisenbacteria bacterium]|nr:hypothetical protein [Candidatus Eisenbacteria bacterium]
MPIVDIEVVCQEGTDASSVSAQALADALGQVFGSTPGSTWVRVHTLLSSSYAENEVELRGSPPPAFVTILHAHPPMGEARTLEVLAVTNAVASCLGRTA